MLEELKKAELRRGSTPKALKMGDRDAFSRSKNLKKLAKRAPVPDLTGGEVLDDESEPESDSESQNLRKRRPIRKHKHRFPKSVSSKSEMNKASQERAILKLVSSKTTAIESTLESVLLSVLALPENIDSHLTTVFNSLTDIESQMDIYEKDQTQDVLFNSKIGKFLVVINRLVTETYPSHALSRSINDTTASLMNRAATLLVTRVTLV